MSGPALFQRHAHHAIHESAFCEAEELTEILGELMTASDYDKATMVVPVLIEHWQTRTLVHADEEERGLYQEILEQRPEAEPLIHTLKRDHQLLHLIVDEIKGVMTELGSEQEDEHRVQSLSRALDGFKMLLWINRIHSSTEETKLLNDESRLEKGVV